jgi:hypothetical protein
MSSSGQRGRVLQTGKQRAQPAPADLYTNANQNERRQPDQHVDAGFSEIAHQRDGKAIGAVDRQRDREQAKQSRARKQHRVRTEWVMAADRQGQRDRAGSDGERQCQRIETIISGAGVGRVVQWFTARAAASLSSFHPIAVTSIPPATRTTGIEMPKNSRMSDPNKVDPTNSQKLLKATSNASRVRCCGVRSAVRLRKSGAAPSGFTTGNTGEDQKEGV